MCELQVRRDSSLFRDPGRERGSSCAIPGASIPLIRGLVCSGKSKKAGYSLGIADVRGNIVNIMEVVVGIVVVLVVFVVVVEAILAAAVERMNMCV